MPEKSKMALKFKKSKVRNEETIENERRSTKSVEPKTLFAPYPGRKNSPLGPQKVKNCHINKLKSKVRIEGIIRVATAYFLLGSILMRLDVRIDRGKVSTNPLITLINTFN